MNRQTHHGKIWSNYFFYCYHPDPVLRAISSCFIIWFVVVNVKLNFLSHELFECHFSSIFETIWLCFFGSDRSSHYGQCETSTFWNRRRLGRDACILRSAQTYFARGLHSTLCLGPCRQRIQATDVYTVRTAGQVFRGHRPALLPSGNYQQALPKWGFQWGKLTNYQKVTDKIEIFHKWGFS